MKKIRNYLDDAKKVTDSDYKTAELLGVSRQAVSKMRRTGCMDIDHCTKLAEILDVNPADIVAAAAIARNPANAKIWGKWVAATVMLSVVADYIFPINSTEYANSAFLPAIYYAHMWIKQPWAPGSGF